MGEPKSHDPGRALVQAKGLEHESAVLARLEARHERAVRMPADGLADQVSATREAMRDGAALIYQAALQAPGGWVGFPDFLVRAHGDDRKPPAYAVEDAKLARTAKVAHVLQLGIYGRLLEKATGSLPPSAAIHTGSGTAETFDLRRTAHITRRLMARFENFVDTRPRTHPIRCPACALCPYKPRCESEWRAADSPIFVAGLTSAQLLKLEDAGVTTLTELAGLGPDASVPGIGRETLARLVAQARLQGAAAETGDVLHELLPVEPGRGFALLPDPDPGDLFFDIEGDPFYPEGLDYLFGLYGPLEPGAKLGFEAFWAHDHAEEKQAFEALMGRIADHLARHPDARIYHYAAYEPNALKRLAMKYATCEAALDDLLRSGRFVDLYRVVRQALRASTEGYSLKDVEALASVRRAGEVTDAGDSIVAYERWREVQDASILAAIARYNEQDCVSTKALRDWLAARRPANAPFGPAAAPEEDRRQAERRAAREASEAERRRLADDVRAASALDPAARDLIAELLWFHQRAAKPAWWAVFDKRTWNDEELAEDLESLGGLARDPANPAYTDKRSFVTPFVFEPQETKLAIGDQVRIAATSERAGQIVALDAEKGRVALKRGTKFGALPEKLSVIAHGPIDQDVLADGVSAFAWRFVSDAKADPALRSILARERPRIAGIRPGAAIVADGADPAAAVVSAVLALRSSHLVVQGPPGTGKTYAASRAILALLSAGRRVAVSSNSHKAINNLLAAVEERAREAGGARARPKIRGAKKGTDADPETHFDGSFIRTVCDSGEIDEHYQLVGATAFHFARPDQVGAFDCLVVDEAGQVALANLVAMGACAKSIVLVGDQMQLAQPVQGVHPGASGLSCLDYLMQGHATVPPDRGILLDVTRRLHPDLCSFVSNAFYDGRLRAHPTAAERRLVPGPRAHPALRPTGLSVVEVAHAGCRQSSVAEADEVAAIVRSALRQSWRDESGRERKLTLADILVVAPFNAQVNVLRRALPEGARVGTVDKFQGQEGVIVIVSMATSRGEDAPRGTAFLFDRNRLNVAVSRAKCLAVLVRSRDLLEMVPGSIPDLERLDPFAQADDVADVGLEESTTATERFPS